MRHGLEPALRDRVRLPAKTLALRSRFPPVTKTGRRQAPTATERRWSHPAFVRPAGSERPESQSREGTRTISFCRQPPQKLQTRAEGADLRRRPVHGQPSAAAVINSPRLE